MAVLLLSIAGSLFGWEFLVRRIGKRNSYFLGVLVWVLLPLLLFVPDASPQSLGHLAAFLLPQDAGWAFWIIMPVVGVGVGAGILIPWAMLPETVELDEVRRSRERLPPLPSSLLSSPRSSRIRNEAASTTRCLECCNN